MAEEKKQYTEEEKSALPKLHTVKDDTLHSNVSTVVYNKDKEKFYDQKNWYAVYCQPQHELQIHDYLMGIEKDMKKLRRGTSKKENFFVKIDPDKILMECFVPTQYLHLKYSDRMVWKEKVLTPGLIFVHCKLNKRDALFDGKIREYITGFLVDRERHWPQAIPEDEMKLFMDLVHDEYVVSIEKPTFKKGDRVLVLEGTLNGRVAYVAENRQTISSTEFEKDRQGIVILDAEGNPIHKRKQTLCVYLNSQLAAIFEVDADKVIKAPADAPDYAVYE